MAERVFSKAEYEYIYVILLRTCDDGKKIGSNGRIQSMQVMDLCQAPSTRFVII